MVESSSILIISGLEVERNWVRMRFRTFEKLLGELAEMVFFLVGNEV